MKTSGIYVGRFIFIQHSMRKIYLNYIENFSGLSTEIWMLSLVTFINRAGAMVIPFLSLYLVKSKGFTLPQVGWIMACYGLGSLVGTLIGGRLTDAVGFYKVIVLSFFISGLGFIAYQFLDTFYTACIGIFVLMLLVDSYRPAVFVACEAYSKPENVTRGIALIRLAINLGFAIGPVIGGIIIARIGYSYLFWIDGITCILAASLLFVSLKPKQSTREASEETTVKEGVPPYKNGLYMLFFFIILIGSMAFVQYFSTVPLYYEQEHGLSEDLIGLLFLLNAGMIVLFEMPLVGWLEKIGISKAMATFLGIFFVGISFIVLNVSSWSGVLVIGMFLMTIGEMIGSPFSNSLALEMAPKGRKGSYMAFYTMSWSLSHIIGHKGSMDTVNAIGFDATWTVLFIASMLVGGLTIWLHKLRRKSTTFTEQSVDEPVPEN